MGAVIIAENSNLIGGDNAVFDVDESYSGHCEVLTFNDDTVAVLPNYKEARAVATYAISPDGGYESVIVVEAPNKKVSHQSFDEWILT